MPSTGSKESSRPVDACDAPERQPCAKEAPPDCEQLFRELVRRANEGDGDALARLRTFLDKNPAIWERAGDLNAMAERAWIGLVAGHNRLAAESIQRKLGQIKSDLAGPHPSRLESLLVDLVGVTWLAAHHGEIDAASPPGD